MILDWIYMCDEHAIDKMIFSSDKNFDIEVWNELGVVEISRDKASIDLEKIPVNRFDDFSKDLLDELNYTVMYQVTIGKGADKWADEVMRLICSVCGGRFCADTEDLKPYIE